MTSAFLCQKKIIIATHVYATGPAQELRKYLLESGAGKVLFIGHPLMYLPRIGGSGYELYTQGEKVRGQYGKARKIPTLLAYVKDVILNLLFSIRFGYRWDLFVGCDNLNAFCGVVLRKLGFVRKVVYYVVDYNPNRFANPLLNRIYHALDQFCVRHCDETWNLSPVMAEAREHAFGFTGGTQMVVPMGLWQDRLPRPPKSELCRHRLVFVGHILEKQGVQHALRAMPLILQRVLDATLLVMGGGEYLDILKRMTMELGIADHVTFTGYVERDEDIEQMLARSGLALALYNRFDKDGNLSFTCFADPGKLKLYLACGLPVLLTDVPSNAAEIQDRRCGVIVENKPEEIARAAMAILTDELKQDEYKQNALAYASAYSWPAIFHKALDRVFAGH